jgi:hypothetical protein
MSRSLSVSFSDFIAAYEASFNNPNQQSIKMNAEIRRNNAKLKYSIKLAPLRVSGIFRDRCTTIYHKSNLVVLSVHQNLNKQFLNVSMDEETVNIIGKLHELVSNDLLSQDLHQELGERPWMPIPIITSSTSVEIELTEATQYCSAENAPISRLLLQINPCDVIRVS